MRLLEKTDTSLAIALVAGALVIFQKPLQVVFDSAREIERHYNIDLIPGLVVLATAFAFHQHRKRQQAKGAAAAAAADVAVERQRSGELERLVAFGGALGNALDMVALRQVFRRYFPAFSHDREIWLLIRSGEGWDGVARDATAPARRTAEALEALAKHAVNVPVQSEAQADGVTIGDDVCFPMAVGDASIGVVGVKNAPALSLTERRGIGAAVALLGIAIRNVELLTQTRESSVRDQLTGCFNRAYAIETLATELQRARRSGQPLSVMMFDVDRLKNINDRHGHLAGDALLSAVGSQLAATLRASDVKCRWGGDEFLIVLPDTPLAGAEHAGASLTREVEMLRVQTGSGMVMPTVSVGVAVAEDGETDPMALVARADAALYRAKGAGRNRLVVAPASTSRIAG
jgi:diguanylate cyclase (GGDEF)-like protein